MGLLEQTIDRLAGRLGYQRVLLAEEKPQTIELAEHLLHEQAFDYTKARAGSDGVFLHRSEQAWFWAIGKRGWMPIALAGFVLGGQVRQGISLFSQAIDQRLWLPSSGSGQCSSVCSSWLAANENIIKGVADIEVTRARRMSNNADVFVSEMFLDLEPSRISRDLRRMWRRSHPLDDGPAFLSDTREYGLLWKLSVMQRAVSAPREALDQLLDWTADWLQAGGLDVDRANMLVAADGYEPLYHVDDDPSCF